MSEPVAGDEVLVIGDVIEVARRRHPLRWIVAVAVLAVMGWGLSRYVASRRRRAISPGASAGVSGGGAGSEGEAG